MLKERTFFCKNAYSQLCETEQLPIFMQSWWLDAVCGATNWQAIVATDTAQKVLGAMIFFTKKKYGFSMITQAPLTPFSGMWLRAMDTFDENKAELIVKQLVAQIPTVHFYQQHFHYEFKNHLPFYWADYQQTTRYTYVVDCRNDLDFIEKNYNKSVRRNIEKGKNIVIRESRDVAKLYELHLQSGSRAAIKHAYNQAFLEKIITLSIENNCGKILEAIVEERVVASIFVLFDKNSAYLLVTGMDIRQKTPAMTILIQQAIRLTKEKGISFFDFDGSILQNVEPMNRSFGGEQKAYHRIFKAANWFFNLGFLLR